MGKYLLALGDVTQTSARTFFCWELASLEEIAPIFRNDFLATTAHDPGEVVGATQLESGWFELDGQVAASSQTVLEDPAILGCLIEFRPPSGLGASLPFLQGTQDNGDLLPRSCFGDS